MLIHITARKIALRRTLESFIRERIKDVLEPFAGGIALARVELSDRNGRRGGGDKRCRIRLQLAQGSLLSVEHVDANIWSTIRRAVDRAHTAVRRHARPT